jgi:ABC-type branched-subunit amino acid transport system ATPase component
VKELMKTMRDDGHAIIFVSHNMDIVRELSDYIIVMDSGTLLAEGEVDDVLSRPEVIEAYLGS